MKDKPAFSKHPKPSPLRALTSCRYLIAQQVKHYADSECGTNGFGHMPLAVRGS
jgi:hypothetical protein